MIVKLEPEARIAGYDVLVPSAILVPEALRDVGDLPAAVYPLNQGVVLDSIRACYPARREMVVVGREGAGLIRRYIEGAGDPAMRFVELDAVGDLCDTVLAGLQACKGDVPVVLNFSDTVAHGDILEIPNSFYFSRERRSGEWTFFEEEADGIRVTSDKDPAAAAAPGCGMAFVGVFRFDDPAAMAAALEEAIATGSAAPVSCFYRALEAYSRTRPMEPLEPTDWLDIGHRRGYVSAQLQVKAREFNHISIDGRRAILRKTSEDVGKFLGEVCWYLKLPSDVSYAAPRVFAHSLAYDDPWVEMEYYPYHTLHSLWLNGGLDRASWAEIFGCVAFVLRDFARYRLEDDPANVSAALEEVYLGKTLSRLGSLRAHLDFASFFEGPVFVNSRRYPSLAEVGQLLRAEVPRRLCDGDAEMCLVHGDLCFANVMVDGSLSFVKLVDPRGSFGRYDIYGDRRYELAKLVHSVDGGYDCIIADRFEAAFDPAMRAVDFELRRPSAPADMYGLLRECLGGLLEPVAGEVEFIEALLFLSMLPLHSESLAHQMAMLGTGLELLDRSLGIGG